MYWMRNRTATTASASPRAASRVRSVRVFKASRISWTRGITTAPLVHPRAAPRMRDRGTGIPRKMWSAAAMHAVAKRNARNIRRKTHFNWRTTRSTSRFIPPSSMIMSNARVPT